MSYLRLIEFSERKQSWIRAYYWAVIFGVALAGLSLLSSEAAIWSIFVVMGAAWVIIFPIWLLPLHLIWTDQNLRESERITWILVTLFCSWFAWILYLLIAPVISPKRPTTEE